jgi:hypothetical protein
LRKTAVGATARFDGPIDEFVYGVIISASAVNAGQAAQAAQYCGF